MRKLKVHHAGALALATCLAGCGYEKGFEFKTEAKLVPTDERGIGGSLEMGHGEFAHVRRLRIALRGLDRNVQYHVRLYNASSCEPGVLATASRVDAKSVTYGDQDGWGFEAQPALVSGNFFGFGQQEFQLNPPSESSIHYSPYKYPTVVIAAQDASMSATAPSTNVACAIIESLATNRRPHM